MPANPLQELAEKLIAALHQDFELIAEENSFLVDPDVAAILPILTASVGTLLQAERAATVKRAVLAVVTHTHAGWCESLKVTGHIDADKCNCWNRSMAEDIEAIATPEAASALAAVVQRETEKLRELLRESVVILHQEFCAYVGGGNYQEVSFEDCPTTICKQAREALK